MSAISDHQATGTRAPRAGRRSLYLGISALAILVLCGISMFVGVADLGFSDLFAEQTRGHALNLMMTSRLPRTAALVLAGSSLAVCGLIMQLLTRNVFVEPSTAGTMEFAGLGLVLVMLFWPGAPVWMRMLAGTALALAGTAIFLKILNAIPMRDILVVPLIGLMLGGVVAAAATFLAYRADLLQSLGAWTTGDFSAVLAGRYELLWVAGLATVVALVVADRFTVAGMGEAFTTNLGLNYRRTMALGLTVVSIVSAIIVVTVGMLPFLGLVVPNVVRLIVGDNARRAVPLVALGGAGLLLICDLIARVVVYPFELPIGTVMGVIGAAAFLYMLLRKGARHGA
ncbi:ABC transporter permease [Blastococcus sp. Marseille-P5729]|uniref:ABC transporter permease n=1 Tax=Blastococcus sp. Marseille-P5729 TaxID=2086582 RepID=UPI0018FE64EC|nr:ABC transporter permease [Blastococcus sp. Marseille-P5729]